MNVVDELRLARGIVAPSFVDLSTGRRMEFERRNNTLSYMAAEAMAAAFGGDPSYIPARIGFIYGNGGTFNSGISRSQSWDGLIEDISSSGDSQADIQVVGFSYSPTLGGEGRAPSGDSGSSSGSSDVSDNYSNILSTGSNAITFHAVSNSQDRGAIRGSGAFQSGSYIYQCVLLGCHVDGSGEERYYVIARASLSDSDGSYLRKPDKFEVALDWTVVFH